MVTRVIYVPFNAAGLSSGVARMPHAIHSAGVEHRLPAPVDARWIEVSGLTRRRGPSGLVSEDALTSVVADTAAAIGETWSSGDVPVVVAGDCTILLAPLIAAAERGEAGLVFIAA
jgi:arginase